jgi:hypothetical protein
MTYSAGGLIQATDYNGFVSTTSGANVNATWNTTYGQTALSTVSATGTVTATQWSTLVNTISSMASHQGTTITSRTPPTAGQTITVLSAVNADIASCYTNRLNAASVGAQYTGWTGTSSKTSATGSGQSAWSITYTHTITFASTAAATYFFNSGGYLVWQVCKQSTGTPGDTEWNAFVGTDGNGGPLGKIIFTSDGASKTINGTSYTGTAKVGGSGAPNILSTSTGYNQLTGTPAVIYRQYDEGAAYNTNYVQISASVSGSVITFTTVWYDDGATGVGATADISGGSATSGISFGTAPTTIVTYYAPESTYISNTWGTPAIAASVA